LSVSDGIAGLQSCNTATDTQSRGRECGGTEDEVRPVVYFSGMTNDVRSQKEEVSRLYRPSDMNCEHDAESSFSPVSI
jgi:hypothetical protein